MMGTACMKLCVEAETVFAPPCGIWKYVYVGKSPWRCWHGVPEDFPLCTCCTVSAWLLRSDAGIQVLIASLEMCVVNNGETKLLTSSVFVS
jgi:hypothetical protein